MTVGAGAGCFVKICKQQMASAYLLTGCKQKNLFAKELFAIKKLD
jgi:hypothetical protein